MLVKYTSAGANKYIKKLQEEKDFLIKKESDRSIYDSTESETEEVIIPDYSFSDTQNKIEIIDAQIVALKHAINVINTTHQIDCGFETLTVDQILIKMAQLNNRKETLDRMRSAEKRTKRSGYSGEVRYLSTNYEPDEVNDKYNAISNQISFMQLALDKFNQTVEFTVEI